MDAERGTGVSKSKYESARKAVNRISRLRRRMNQINRFNKTVNQASEVSAIEWAIPILEQYVLDTYGEKPAERYSYYKHEKRLILARLLADDGDECYLCHKTIPPHEMSIDHIVPLSKGGLDEYSNYALAHLKCNMAKGNALVDYMRDAA